jgi:hypothetical protein
MPHLACWLLHYPHALIIAVLEISSKFMIRSTTIAKRDIPVASVAAAAMARATPRFQPGLTCALLYIRAVIVVPPH